MRTIDDDSISRRRSKKYGINQENTRDSNSIIAAENRCHSGERRLCQGMRFNIPTRDDLSTKMKRSSQGNKNPMSKKVSSLCKVSLGDNNTCTFIQDQEVINVENPEKKNTTLIASINFLGPEIAIDVGKPTCRIIKWDPSKSSWNENGPTRNTGCPSKFLIMCLNSIQNALQQNQDLTTELERPLFADPWGLDFWNCYTNRNNVLETNGDDSTVEKIAWMASTAADTISMKEKEGLSFNGPFLLYLVPSQDRAHKVLQVCKPLKMVGIHTVSLHAGAPLDHQIHGLKRCEPEFVVSTPERLLELVSLKAVDLSEVSLMVIDEDNHFDAIKSIRQFISGNPQTVVFCDSMNNPPFS